MTIINIRADNTDASFFIGRRGENGITQVVFDFSPWVGEFGAGIVTLLVRRSKDESAYPVALTVDGSKATWLVSSTDTQYVGGGRAEFIYTVDEQIAKSVVYKASVLPDIGEPSATPPDPYETWLDTLVNLGAEVEGYAQEAESAAEDAVAAAGAASELVEHYPYIGDDDYWYAWDEDLSEFVSTGVKAKGEDGTDGSLLWTTTQAPVRSGFLRYYTNSMLNGRYGAIPHQGDVVFQDTGDVYYVTLDADEDTHWVQKLASIKGADGYSPTVTVTEITGGHRVTITDAEGDHVFDVMDGTGGGGGTSDYSALSNKPQIEGVTLSGNKTASDLGLAKVSDIPSVPVQSVNGKTGAVSLSASDVGAGTYSKPSGGIPKTDLASEVQTSLGKADTALQSAPVTSVNGQTGAVTISVPSASSATPQALGTAAAGSSADYARADHVHAKPSAADVGAVAVAQGVAHAGEFVVVGSDGNITTVTMTAWSGGNF